MTALNPNLTTAGDICTAALRTSGAYGVGQTPLADNIKNAQMVLQMMLQEWETKRWLVYHLVSLSLVSTGAQTYSIGPGGDFDTGTGSPFSPAFGPAFGSAVVTARPNEIESAFLRQIMNVGTQQPDWPLTIMKAREDYDRIDLKKLVAPSSCLFYDPSWPLGTIYPWPIAPSGMYELHVSVRQQLPAVFATTSALVNLPFGYYSAILYNLAMRLRLEYGIVSMQGDVLPGLAKGTLNNLRSANTAIPKAKMPVELLRPGLYNIFSDTSY